MEMSSSIYLCLRKPRLHFSVRKTPRPQGPQSFMSLPSSQFGKLFMNEFPVEWKILGRSGTFSNPAAFKKLMIQTPRWHGPDPLTHSFGSICWVPRFVGSTDGNREGVWPQSSWGFNGCFYVNNQQDERRSEVWECNLALAWPRGVPFQCQLSPSTDTCDWIGWWCLPTAQIH